VEVLDFELHENGLARKSWWLPELKYLGTQSLLSEVKLKLKLKENYDLLVSSLDSSLGRLMINFAKNASHVMYEPSSWDPGSKLALFDRQFDLVRRGPVLRWYWHYRNSIHIFRLK
jgi:hypothetical protein